MDDDTYSVISKRNRYSNQLIEKACAEMKQVKDNLS